MDFITIFGSSNGSCGNVLESICALNGDGNRYDELIDNWLNRDFIFSYYTQYGEKIRKEAAFRDKKAAAKEIINEARNLLDIIAECASGQICLDNIFTSFNTPQYQQVSPQYMLEHKIREAHLRLYAVKIKPNHYVITGGIIKFTRLAQDSPFGSSEIAMLRRVSHYILKKS